MILRFFSLQIIKYLIFNAIYSLTKIYIDKCNFTLSPLFDNVTSSKKELSFHENLLFLDKNCVIDKLNLSDKYENIPNN